MGCDAGTVFKLEETAIQGGTMNGKPENTGRNHEGRWKPGVSGNPAGKPRGPRHQATRAAEALLEGEAEGLARIAVEAALSGDVQALRLCLDRILPPRKGRPDTGDGGTRKARGKSRGEVMIGLKNRIKKLEARLPPERPPPTPEELEAKAAEREHIASLPGGAALLEARDAEMNKTGSSGILFAFVTSTKGMPSAYQWNSPTDGKAYYAGEDR